MPAPTMPPMTSMEVSKRPSRRTNGWEELDSAFALDELKGDPMVKRFTGKKNYIRIAPEFLTFYRTGTCGLMAPVFFFLLPPAIRASNRWPRQPERNAMAKI